LIFSRFFLTLCLFFLCGKIFLSFSKNWKPLTCGALGSVALRPVLGPLVGWRLPPGAELRPRPPCMRHAIEVPASVRTRSEAASHLARSPGPRLATPLLSEGRGQDVVQSRRRPPASDRKCPKPPPKASSSPGCFGRPPSQLPPPPAPHRRPATRRPPHQRTPPLLWPAVIVPLLLTRIVMEPTLLVSFPFPEPPNGLHTSPPTYSTHPYRFTTGNGQHRPTALPTTMVPLSADPVGHGPLAHGCRLVGLGRPMLAQGEQWPLSITLELFRPFQI
jgi:hypothetical protein